MKSNSNSTSFVTAEDREYSPKAPSERHNHSSLQSLHLSYRRSDDNSETFSNNKDIEHHRSAGFDVQHNEVEDMRTNFEQRLSPSRLSLGSLKSLESGHTITNNSQSEITIGFNEKATNKKLGAEPKTYFIAWVLLFFIILLRIAVALFNNTFTPIPVVTASFLGVSLSSVNWLYNVTSIVYIVACFFTSWMYEIIGVKFSLLLSGVVLALGCWIRWIAAKINPPSFPILILGQIIASFSSPISLNLMTKFATLWFTENWRATAGMFIVSNYGGIVAMFLMPAIATGLDRIEFTLMLVSIIATACTLPFIFFPAKPRTPSSFIAKEEYNVDGELAATQKMTLRKGAVLLFKNPHFLTLAVIHGLNVGLANSWSGLMNQAISPYGYTDSQIGNIAAIGVIGGALGCLVSGPTLDKTKQHKVLLKIMAPLMFSTYIAFVFIIKGDSFASILYTNFINQFFLSFMVPICVELGVEVSYPIPESLSTSILWQLSQITTVIFIIVMDLFREPNGVPKNNMHKALIFQAIIAGICLLFVFVFNGPMLRLRAFREQEEIREDNILELSDKSKASPNVINSSLKRLSNRRFSDNTVQTVRV